MKSSFLFLVLISLCTSAFADVGVSLDYEQIRDAELIYVEIDASANEKNSQTAAIYRAKTVYEQEVRELIAIVPIVAGKKTPDMTNVSPIESRTYGSYQSKQYPLLHVYYAMFFTNNFFMAAARTDLPITDYDLKRTTHMGISAHKIGATQGLSGGSIYFLESDIMALFQFVKRHQDTVDPVRVTIGRGINRDVLPRIK